MVIRTYSQFVKKHSDHFHARTRSSSSAKYSRKCNQLNVFRISICYIRKGIDVPPDKVSEVQPKQKVGLIAKLRQKVTHPFTRNYISERAEQLKTYVQKLEAELHIMENNESIQDLVFQ